MINSVYIAPSLLRTIVLQWPGSCANNHLYRCYIERFYRYIEIEKPLIRVALYVIVCEYNRAWCTTHIRRLLSWQ